jgi:putative membrane protein
MYVKKNFDLLSLKQFSGGHLIWITAWALLATGFTEFLHSINFYECKVPWLPVSLIGTALAFYVGFKNNSAYDRLWEGRKIWGAIVNSSRSWGVTVNSYLSNQFRNEAMDENTIMRYKRTLIYRHIGWLYSLRSQLLIPSDWEHISQGGYMERYTARRIKTFGIGLYADEITEQALPKCLPQDEIDRLINAQNTATQIINQQSQDLKELRALDLIDDFRHMELQKILNDFYTHQGQAERIKKFPFPRQYGSMSFIFTGIFIFLLPFGLVTEFHEMGEWGAWLSIPFAVIVSWVFLMMELVGDYSENPFEGLGNDVPMLSLCRTIKIDLREMLGETELPESIKPINGVLM